MKSSKWELNWQLMMLCVTTMSPIQAVNPAPVNISQWAAHIASRMITPAAPSWIATVKIWLCGLVAVMSAGPSAWRRNSSAMVPVPWPITGASLTMRSEYLQNSSRAPDEVSAPVAACSPTSCEMTVTRARKLCDVAHTAPMAATPNKT